MFTSHHHRYCYQIFRHPCLILAVIVTICLSFSNSFSCPPRLASRTSSAPTKEAHQIIINSRQRGDTILRHKQVGGRAWTTPCQTNGNKEEYGEEEVASTAPSKKRSSRRIIRPRKPSNIVAQQEERAKEVKMRMLEALKDPSLLTNVKFEERTDLHSSSKRAVLEVLGLTSMTEVQAKTYAAACGGDDILARARTGTGKTLAFLLPAIETIIQNNDLPGTSVGAIIISPTRELAIQIHNTAESLLKYHDNPLLTSQVMYGGTKIISDISRMSKRLPSILVSTPGRLHDHIDGGTRINGRNINDIFSGGTNMVLVLDETDRLLDMGFRKTILKVISCLPRKKQTMMFSATIPKKMRSVASEILSPGYVTVDCMEEGDAATHTNARVRQSHVFVPSCREYTQSVVKILREAIRQPQGRGGAPSDTAKIVVFFPTVRMAAYVAQVLENLPPDYLGDIPIMEIHSKKSQGSRNRDSLKFRNAKRGVLLTSDVSARGVDYPDVTNVIQFGAPESRDQYIHRLGRTGRAGKQGEGWLVLSPFERPFLTAELKRHDIPSNSNLDILLNDDNNNSMSDHDPLDNDNADPLATVMNKVRSGNKNLVSSAELAYQAFLGYYVSQMDRFNIKPKKMVVIANEFAESMGLEHVPPLQSKVVEKMGLKGVHGLVVVESAAEGAGSRRRSVPEER